MKKRLPRPLLWLARLLLIGAAAIVLLYFGSNLFLASKPGKSFVQKQLTRRAPALAWSHDEVSWSPWHGITISKLEARLKDHPEAPPLLQLEEGVMRPYWSEAFRGKRVLRELSLSRPVVNIPIEALLVAAPPEPGPSEQTLPTSEGEKEAPLTPSPNPDQLAQPQTDGPERPPRADKLSSTPPPPPPTTPQPAPKKKNLPPEDPRFWVRMVDAEIRLYSLTNHHSVTVKGLSAALPLAGPPTQGSIAWRQIVINNTELIAAAKLPIEWKNPSWILPQQSLPLDKPSLAGEEAGFELQVGGALGVRAKGKPFLFQSYFPPQSLPETLLHQESGLSSAFAQATANFRASGSLAAPMTWQFDSRAAATGLQIFSERRGEHFAFDTASSQIFLRQGVIQAPSIRLRSEDKSLMANGKISLTGSVLGVVRAVVSPEIEEGITRIAIGSFLSRGHTSHWFLPMGTPDRYYRDFHIEGALPDPQINLGRQYEFMQLSQALKIMENFYRQEVAEEPPLPR